MFQLFGFYLTHETLSPLTGLRMLLSTLQEAFSIVRFAPYYLWARLI